MPGLAASGFGLLTGALGSSCSGVNGIAALALGFVTAMGVQWLRGRVRAR